VITPGLDIAAYCQQHRVKFVRKDRSCMMRFFGWMFGLFGFDFMRTAWTTIGRTVYFPISGPRREWIAILPSIRPTIEHELIHVEQYRKLWHMHSLLYVIGFPLPFLFAWYRWRSEREAYLHQIRHYGYSVTAVVDTLWYTYGWCWPRSRMLRWFYQMSEFRKMSTTSSSDPGLEPSLTDFVTEEPAFGAPTPPPDPPPSQRVS